MESKKMEIYELDFTNDFQNVDFSGAEEETPIGKGRYGVNCEMCK